MSTSKYKAQDFIDVIPGSGGIISTIARKAGCDWNTAKKWCTEKPTVRQAYEAECESLLDMAEGVILKSIQGGDSADAKWYLTRKGKQRGYAERIEHAKVSDDELRGMTDEELDAIIES